MKICEQHVASLKSGKFDGKRQAHCRRIASIARSALFFANLLAQPSPLSNIAASLKSALSNPSVTLARIGVRVDFASPCRSC